MKKISLSILALFISSVFFAQEISSKESSTSIEQKAEKVAEKLQKELSLSDQVKAQVYDLNVKRFSELIDLREKRQSESAELKKEALNIRESYQNQLETLLSAEQLKKLQTFRESRVPMRAKKNVAKQRMKSTK